MNVVLSLVPYVVIVLLVCWAVRQDRRDERGERERMRRKLSLLADITDDVITQRTRRRFVVASVYQNPQPDGSINIRQSTAIVVADTEDSAVAEALGHNLGKGDTLVILNTMEIK